MGTSKAFLPFNGGKTFLGHLLEVYHDFGCGKAVVVANGHDKAAMEKDPCIIANARLVENQHPELGRFYSIQLGVKCLTGREGVFIQNIDNPFVDIPLLGLLTEGLTGFDFALPEYKSRKGHPLLLSDRIRHDLLYEKDTFLNLRDFLKRYRGAAIAVEDPLVRANINRPEDYLKHFGRPAYEMTRRR